MAEGARNRIVLLCGPGYSTELVYSVLSELDADVEVILESPSSLPRNIRRRIKRFGFSTALGQMAFRAIIVPLLRFTTRRRIREIAHDLPMANPIAESGPHRVPSVNSPIAHRLLDELRPDLVVVNGTQILSRETLKAIDVPIINMHTGITPLYRGVHGGYWARVDGHSELLGTTVHRVDPGVDTGEILGRAFATPDRRDTFVSYPYLQLKAGLPVLVQVARAELGISDPQRVADLELDSVQRYHPTLWQYVKVRLRQGVK